MGTKQIKWNKLPGWITNLMMVFFTLFWTFWGINEMYHEGWWGSWLNRLPYLVPILITLAPTLIGFTYPFISSGMIAVLAVAAFFIFGLDNPIVGLFLLGIACLYLFAGFEKRKKPSQTIHPNWWRRNLWQAITLGTVLLIIVVSTINMLPTLITRFDDGNREARRIVGNNVDLIWAPLGPGWNWQQPWGGYPSWQTIALYGKDPIGMNEKPGYGRTENGYTYATQADFDTYNLCRYLSEDGTSLQKKPVDFWRMPTTDEMVRSLVHDNQNAGCFWQGETKVRVSCTLQPDKESPLWSTDHAPIYYWTADAYDEKNAYFVAYNGTVNYTRKNSGNPRHSYRCVHTP